MRLQRGQEVAGVEPGLAREVARAASGDEARCLDQIASRMGVKAPVDGELRPALDMLTGAGYFELTQVPWPGDGWDSPMAPTDAWRATVAGSALGMATFLKPMSRMQAEKLLRGVVERAEAYNADPTKLLCIEELVLFGSYLDPDVTELGDVDIAMRTSRRVADDDWVTAVIAYSNASGRSFPTFVDSLFWPEVELRQILKNRSPRVGLVNDPDVSAFTDRWKTCYRREPALIAL